MSDSTAKSLGPPPDVSSLSLFDDLLIPVCAVDVEQNIIYFNQQISGFLKLPPRKFRGKSLADVVRCPVLQSGDLIPATFRDWHPKVSEETSIELEGGEVKDVIIKTIPQETASGRFVVITMLDNSIERTLHEKHRRQLEELKAKNEEIQQYSDGLEVLVDERTKELRKAREQSEQLLLNILPKKIAERLKHSNEVIADRIPSCSVLFADIVNFTTISSTMDPVEVVGFLSLIFDRFDRLVAELGLEKIKTIGDAYLVAAGLPDARDDHAIAICDLALRMQSALNEINEQFDFNLKARIGINSGPVVAGVLGITKFAYDIWGDAVNVASRMESHGEAGKIQISSSTYEAVAAHFSCQDRGSFEVKGKGNVHAYWLLSQKR